MLINIANLFLAGYVIKYRVTLYNLDLAITSILNNNIAPSTLSVYPYAKADLLKHFEYEQGKEFVCVVYTVLKDLCLGFLKLVSDHFKEIRMKIDVTPKEVSYII